jgi:hypothetical protein
LVTPSAVFFLSQEAKIKGAPIQVQFSSSFSGSSSGITRLQLTLSFLELSNCFSGSGTVRYQVNEKGKS